MADLTDDEILALHGPNLRDAADRCRLAGQHHLADSIESAMLMLTQWAGELKRLRRWKAEAVEVSAVWTKVWVALGKPGALGGSIAAASLAEVERLTAERDRLVVSARESQAVAQRHRDALERHLTPDPDAPPILCERVEPTQRDGQEVPTFEATGRQIGVLARLDPDGWEVRHKDWKNPDDWWPIAPTYDHGSTYLVRRVAQPAPEPAEPEMVTLTLQKDVAQRYVDNSAAMRGDPLAVADACRAALTEDGAS